MAACLSLGQPCPAADRTRELLDSLAKEAESVAPLHLAAETAREPGGPPDPAAEIARGGADGFSAAAALTEAIEAWRRWARVHADEWFVLTGLASPEERRRAAIAAGAVMALAASSSAVIDRAVESADRAPPRDDDAAVEAAVMRSLHDRQIVLPLRAARAAVVLARCADADAAGRLSAASAELALRVEGVSAWSAAERLIVSGWALLGAGKFGEAQTAFERARDAADAPDAAPAVREAAWVEAALGEAQAMSRTRGPVIAREALMQRYDAPPFASAGGRDVRACLSAIGVLIDLAPREAEKAFTAGARRHALACPWIVARDLAAAQPTPARSQIYDRLGRRVPVDSIAVLPDVARIALAWRRLADGAPADADAALTPIIDPSRPPAGPIERDAWRLFVLAASASDDAASLARVQPVAAGFAACCGEDERAAEMLAVAAASAETRLRLAGAPDERAAAERDLLESLRLLSHGGLAMAPADRDRWRLALGRLRLALVARGPVDESAKQAAAAAESLRQVATPGLVDEARVLTARAWSAWLRVAEDDPAETGVPSIAAELVRFTDSPLTPSPAAGESANGMRAWWSACRAHAFAATHSPDRALEEVSPLLAQPAAAMPTDALRAVLEQGLRALLALEREDDARTLCDRLEAAEGSSAWATSRLAMLAWRAVQPRTKKFIDGPSQAGPTPIAVFRLAADRARDPAMRGAHLGRLGWSLLLAGRAEESASAFRASIEAQGRVLGVLRGLGEALLASGRDADAFALFREIAEALGVQQDFTADYWHAWTRMLEILARRPRSPDSDASIRREIARLRTLDSARDHPECLERLERVEALLSADRPAPPTPSDR